MPKPRWMRDFLRQAEAAGTEAPVLSPVGRSVRNRSGRAGVVKGTASGYLLVRVTGSDKLLGYLPDELEVLDG